jgi:hypothetical protein
MQLFYRKAGLDGSLTFVIGWRCTSVLSDPRGGRDRDQRVRRSSVVPLVRRHACAPDFANYSEGNLVTIRRLLVPVERAQCTMARVRLG